MKSVWMSLIRNSEVEEHFSAQKHKYFDHASFTPKDYFPSYTPIKSNKVKNMDEIIE